MRNANNVEAAKSGGVRDNSDLSVKRPLLQLPYMNQPGGFCGFCFRDT